MRYIYMHDIHRKKNLIETQVPRRMKMIYTERRIKLKNIMEDKDSTNEKEKYKCNIENFLEGRRKFSSVNVNTFPFHLYCSCLFYLLTFFLSLLFCCFTLFCFVSICLLRVFFYFVLSRYVFFCFISLSFIWETR